MLELGFGAFAVVGALLVVRRPTNAIGWIMAAIGLMVSMFGLGSAYATYVMATRDRPGALAVFGAWAANWYWFVMLVAGPDLSSHALSQRAADLPPLATCLP